MFCSDGALPIKLSDRSGLGGAGNKAGTGPCCSKDSRNLRTAPRAACPGSMTTGSRFSCHNSTPYVSAARCVCAAMSVADAHWRLSGVVTRRTCRDSSADAYVYSLTDPGNGTLHRLGTASRDLAQTLKATPEGALPGWWSRYAGGA
jgi:hypothetical protein